MTSFRQLSPSLRVLIATPWLLVLAIAAMGQNSLFRSLQLDGDDKPTGPVNLSSSKWTGTLDAARLPAALNPASVGAATRGTGAFTTLSSNAGAAFTSSNPSVPVATFSGPIPAAFTGTNASATVFDLSHTSASFSNSFLYIHTPTPPSAAFLFLDCRADGQAVATIDGAGRGYFAGDLSVDGVSTLYAGLNVYGPTNLGADGTTCNGDLNVTGGLYCTVIIAQGDGLVLHSPSGVAFRVTVDDDGNLSASAW